MMNPFEEKPKSIKNYPMDWKTLYAAPYDKNTVDPHTKCRIILMNGIEVESVMFQHNFHRNCGNNDLRRDLAEVRRNEQEQQKQVNWLSPGDETQLETTIGYEHVAVDLTAWLAQHEPDAYVKQCMDFALLEDFDHLYRYANLLKMDMNIPAHKLVRDYVEITPGRPTIAHHRHPFDTVRKHCNAKKAALQTLLNTLIITAGEQQTMNFYMNIGPTYPKELGRQLYQEIAMVEEQHVTQYGALLDTGRTWLENLVLRDYMESYLYYSFSTDEPDRHIRKIWEIFFEQEVAHLHKAVEALKKYEKKEWQQVIPGTGEYPELLHFKTQKEYVREVLASQIELTADRETFVDIHDLLAGHEFFDWQKKVNGKTRNVPSHEVVEEYIGKNGRDYRSEEAENPVPALQDRKADNTEIGRIK